MQFDFLQCIANASMQRELIKLHILRLVHVRICCYARQYIPCK